MPDHKAGTGPRARPGAGTDGYLPIADHGMIGDLRTAALVGTDGTIDWFCPGRFDAPSVFGAVLDPEEAGAWRIAPVEEATATHQFYFPDSNVLVTRFLTREGVVEVQDFMVVLRAHDDAHRQRLVRRVTCVRGRSTVRMDLAARPDYGREVPLTEAVEDGVLIRGEQVRLGLSSSVDLEVHDGDVACELELRTGDAVLFVLEVLEADEPVHGCSVDDAHDLFAATAAFWRGWLAQSTYKGRWREMVHRSALTLKMLTHEPTGAVVGAPTTSLPEQLGGERNWDYRYVWMRDAAFTLYALLRLGFTDESAAFMRWLEKRVDDRQEHDEGEEDLGPLRVLYDIDGRVPHESTLDHLAGYRGSRPVRVGNAAVDQLQLDIYGELIDSIYLYNKYGDGISHDAWHNLTRVLEWLMDNWQRDDAGMWEIRNDPRPHTTSKLMAWVAIERMIRTARQRGLPGDLSRWSEARDEVYDRIMERSWNRDLGAFTQVEGGDQLDAGVLLLPMVKFVAPGDPRFVSTLEAVEERLVSDTLVFRYDHAEGPEDGDGVAGSEAPSPSARSGTSRR